MTFSLLARDPKTGKTGGVAATGNLCVGGWVLSGHSRAGMVASQGQAPSTLWRETVVSLMASGVSAVDAVNEATAADEGREHRQLAAMDKLGRTGAFTGAQNGNYKGHICGENCIASGNILAGRMVLDEMVKIFESSRLPFEERLVEALIAGEQSGGDERGIFSSALLSFCSDRPPLSLRVDYHDRPVKALADLLARTREPGYAAWLETVPTEDEPQKFSPPSPKAKTGTD